MAVCKKFGGENKRQNTINQVESKVGVAIKGKD